MPQRKKMNHMQSEGCRILVCHGPDCTEGGSGAILFQEHVVGGRPVETILLREDTS